VTYVIVLILFNFYKKSILRLILRCLDFSLCGDFSSLRRGLSVPTQLKIFPVVFLVFIRCSTKYL
jgi:hypothetical protein